MRLSPWTPALACLLACGAAALDADSDALLRAVVIRGVRDGSVTRTTISFGGAPTRVQIKAADESSLTVSIAGSSMPLPWSQVEPRRLAAMAAKTAASGAEWWALGTLYRELGASEDAENAFLSAARADPAFQEKYASLLAPPAPDTPPADAPADSPPALDVPVDIELPPSSGGKDDNFIFPPAKGATPKRGLRTDRPRLLIAPERLQYLRSAGRSLPGYSEMRSWCNQNNSNWYYPMHAMVYVVEGDRTFGRRAVDGVIRNTFSKGVIRDLNDAFPSMATAALVYDWCHPLLSDDEKQQFIDWLVAEYQAMQNTYKGYNYHNYFTASAWAFAWTGYALHGDHPMSAQMIQNACRDRFEKGILEACVKGNAGGAWAEGEGYSYTTVPDVIYLAEAIRTCEGIDHFRDPRFMQFFYNRLAYCMFAVYPGVHPPAKMVFFIRGDGVRGGNTLNARENILSLTYAYTGTRLSAYAQNFLSNPGYTGSPYRDGLWHDVLWRCLQFPSLPIRNFRLSHHAWGQGVVLMKSDWTDNATFVSFICGDHYSYHQHSDSGAFTIVRFGQELAVDSGEYDGSGGSAHAANYHSRTIAHNSIVLTGYEKSEMNAHRIGPADDGGQPVGKQESFLETGNIIAYDPERTYTYVAGDVTPSFDGRVQRWVRHMLFIRPEVIVVYDVIASPANHAPRWLIHTWNEPQVNENTFRAEKGDAALLGRVVFPKTCDIKKIGGADNGFLVAGRNYPPPRRGGETALWRLEVTNPTHAGTTNYIVVLQACRKSVQDMIPVAALPDGSAGCTIGSNVTVRFNGNGAPGGTLTIGGKTYDLATSVKRDVVP
ncbi:MAG: heparinase II/III family protein [Planctomycetes bacterium]|nr:heparinase II/III family protein [Planctomycetota bacterium]